MVRIGYVSLPSGDRLTACQSDPSPRYGYLKMIINIILAEMTVIDLLHQAFWLKAIKAIC